MNLKNFKEEQAALEPQEEVAIDEVSDVESLATEEATEEEMSEEAETETEQDDEPGTLAELLQSLVAKERGGNRQALPPGRRGPERAGPSVALPPADALGRAPSG